MAAEIDNTTPPDEITLEKPERGAKDGYLQTYFNMKSQMGKIIMDSNGIGDHRIRLFVLNEISSITDDTTREKLINILNEKIKSIKDQNLDAAVENQMIADFCVGEMQGQVTAFYDEFLGITHRLKLGTV